MGAGAAIGSAARPDLAAAAPAPAPPLAAASGDRGDGPGVDGPGPDGAGPGPGHGGAGWTARRIAREVAVAPMVVWNRFVSPALPPRCKYEPSCSRYAIEAVREFGIIKGLVLAGWRLLRCNPWSHGGFDPVADQRVFGRRPARRA